MSDKASEPDVRQSDTGELFNEDDHAETQMSFDTGGLPVYVGVVWVAFIAAYIIYMVVYGLPDLKAWGAP